MNECLITRLKSSINDESLPLMGKLRFVFPYVESPTITTKFCRVYANDNGNVTLTTNSIFQETGTNTITILKNNNRDIHVENKVGGAIVTIDNVYNLKGLDADAQTKYAINQQEVESLYYCEGLEAISLKVNGTLDLSKFKYHNLKFFTVNTGDTILNTHEISKFTNLVQLSLSIKSKIQISSVKNINTLQSLSYATGNIADMPLNIRQYGYSSNAEVTGTLESLIDRFRNGGRKTGAIKLVWGTSMNGVMFNGKTLAQSFKDLNITGVDSYVKWDESTITLLGKAPDNYIPPIGAYDYLSGSNY